MARLTVTALVLLTILLYGRDLMHSVGSYGDSFHHLMNGIFVFDAARHAGESLADPMGFAEAYYRRFPAVNIGYYPPVFYITEAALMAVFGVSSATGQLAVLLMAVLMALFAYAWLRLRLSVAWAGAGAALIVSSPWLVRWGRDIMLEVPVVAWMLGAIWAFERLLRCEKPTWRGAMLWAFLTCLALGTKQQSILLLGVFFIAALVTGRWRLLRFTPLLVAVSLVAAAAIALIIGTLALGGAAVAHTIGPTTQHAISRWNLSHWTYYPALLPESAGWPLLVAALLGLAVVLWRRETYLSPIMAWIAVFYVMHSYFKARDERYCALWLPPFFGLAVIGLARLAAAWRDSNAPRQLGRVMASAAMLLLLSVNVFEAAADPLPIVPSAYQRVAQDLCEGLSPFACVSFLPDRPGRLVVCYRLAIEQRRDAEHDVDDFGTMLRAGQILRGWQDRWADAAAVGDQLDEWGVKYLVTEHPRPLYVEEDDPMAGDPEVSAVIESLISSGRYRPVRSYAVSMPGRHFPRRTLTTYQRTKALTYNPTAVPELRPKRIDLRLTREGAVRTASE